MNFGQCFDLHHYEMTLSTTKGQIYPLNKVVCFVSFVRLRSLSNHSASCCPLDISEKLLMSKGAPSWFETVWSYGVEAIDY
jgi:hypothetical protein